eukprot:scaffold2373_cov239-Pinguiococcus_pyrenoidosus.AAC.8
MDQRNDRMDLAERGAADVDDLAQKAQAQKPEVLVVRLGRAVVGGRRQKQLGAEEPKDFHEARQAMAPVVRGRIVAIVGSQHARQAVKQVAKDVLQGRLRDVVQHRRVNREVSVHKARLQGVPDSLVSHVLAQRPSDAAHQHVHELRQHHFIELRIRLLKAARCDRFDHLVGGIWRVHQMRRQSSPLQQALDGPQRSQGEWAASLRGPHHHEERRDDVEGAEAAEVLIGMRRDLLSTALESVDQRPLDVGQIQPIGRPDDVVPQRDDHTSDLVHHKSAHFVLFSLKFLRSAAAQSSSWSPASLRVGPFPYFGVQRLPTTPLSAERNAAFE